ncbi:MAG: hypothetical protein QNK26_16035 [Moritella sp.]|uniref:hypothetical protein n=1 Tax=Moritella sp. TaxID=78556 RepID=UPI0029A49493|nr:hypothetical protein [Moritella sp.]MDX2322095.1 hypothetical protein [Moritella sp.]
MRRSEPVLTNIDFEDDILVGIGWCWSSFLEGYAQSGAMGLTLFCGSGILIIITTWRHLIAPELKLKALS